MSALFALLLAAGASGVVYHDANANGHRDPGEHGLSGVVVSDGGQIVRSGSDGYYALDHSDRRHVFVVVPGDRRAAGGWYGPNDGRVDFALAPASVPAAWRFAHLSDTHVHAGNVDRLRRALALARERGASLAVVSGDLVRDALRVGEPVARGQYALYAEGTARAGLEVRSAPGNHEVFGIEREQSGVPATHPLYGKAMYEAVLGPRYYAFNRGGVHFLVLDTVGIEDQWYYGGLDREQLDWIARQLEHVPRGTTVVTVGHMPLRSGALSREFVVEGPARTLLTVQGVAGFRHVVRNTKALVDLLQPYHWTLALQGHSHMAERLRMWDGGPTRFHTAPAVDRQPWAPWPNGIVVYTVRGAEIDDGELALME